ncbi:hypothetical protein, conserved [Plasmodium gonderi]|uniref:ribonuclease Z n=1 Tax=Plasmodium gonderi TaxID=77519 RepID=A0A1Y1JNM6_PLAGO|nr:hypothetical protein, conserved [Plasmodium gonderi]GAW82432.1 hypothetical protein, conserved [Plasmodium gonderi]
MEVYIQMVGWHSLAVPPSLRLFVNGECTLFNCGENIQRFLNEYKLHVAKIRNICFTKINPETIGGLIGLLLTIDNIADIDITIYGPKPIEQIINTITCSFAKMKNIKLKIHEFCENNFQIVLKGNITITPIMIREKKKQDNDICNKSGGEMDYKKSQIIPESDKTHCEGTNNLHRGAGIKHESSGETDLDNFKKRRLWVDCQDMHKENDQGEKTDLKNAQDEETAPENAQGDKIDPENAQGDKIDQKNSKSNKILDKEKDPNRGTYKENGNKTKSGDDKVNKELRGICYLIECPETIGKFHVEKAKKLNIPSGKYYGILKSGKSITINNKVIKPEDVCDKNINGRKALVIDLEDIDDTKYLLGEISSRESFYLKNLEYIFHLSCEEITNMENYKKFFLNLKNVKNVKCNQSNSYLNVCPFVSAASLNNFLSKLLPTIFLKYKLDTPVYDISNLSSTNDNRKKMKNETEGANLLTVDKEDGSIYQNRAPPSAYGFTNNDNFSDTQETGNDIECEQNSSYLVYNPLSKFVLHPFHKINICTDEALRDLYPNIFNSAKTSNILKENENLLENFKNFNNKITQNYSEYPSFYFLGTGCSMPSTFRNVSGIILNIEKNFSVVLDFGEGSLYQLYWMSQSWINFSEAIKSIKIVFISHAHADHHMGLYYLLHMRKILFPHLDEPLILIPLTLKKWICLYRELFFDKPIKILYNEENLEVKQKINDSNNFVFLRPFKVNHIKESYGIKIESKTIGSIVYSADTRPCDNVKMFSKNCDILIHEATFDDELLEEAIYKKHSTTNEAMQIGLEVQCKTLILTHFSQRYPKAPKLNKPSSTEIKEIMNKTIYSFDYMCIPLNLINELPHYFNILLNLLEKIF